mmetsp:Transcript_32762/g.103658  ORF Transcript_32762/g.103658 Transcript_32762/m.103658 type:complete len:179 (+) Transcript_32762:122-658(+)
MQHIGTVFVLDSDRNGRVTLSELYEFAALCSRKREEFRQHDYPMQLQGFCTLRMLDTVLSEGMELFVRWFQALFTEGYEECFLPEYPNVAFVGRDTAHLMHEVLHVDNVYGYDMQSFFDLLQRSGEELGIMSLEDERLDELVPKLVVEKFAKSFGEGFINLLHNELKFRSPTEGRLGL